MGARATELRQGGKCPEKRKVLEVFSYRGWDLERSRPGRWRWGLRIAPRSWGLLISCDYTPSAGQLGRSDGVRREVIGHSWW